MDYIFEAKTEIPKCIIVDDVLIILRKTLLKIKNGKFDKEKKSILEAQLLKVANTALIKIVNQIYKDLVVSPIPYMSKFHVENICYLLEQNYLEWNQLSFDATDLTSTVIDTAKMISLNNQKD